MPTYWWQGVRRFQTGALPIPGTPRKRARRELDDKLAPRELLPDWLALPHALDFLSSLILQFDGLVSGLLAQVRRLFLHSLESGLLGGLERRRLRQVLFGERDGNNALAVLADLESQRAEGNAHTFLADAEEPTDTDDDRADLTLAVEGEVIDIAHQLARRVVYGLADEHPGKELVGRLLGDERQIATGCAASLRQGLAGKRSCCQGQGAGQNS